MVDIREAQQLECLTCALGIDACDDVMVRMGKPRGLFNSIALRDEEDERAGMEPNPIWKYGRRPRTILYGALWLLVGLGVLFALFIRADIDLAVSAIRNPLMIRLADGSIRNTYDMRIRTITGADRRFDLAVTSEPPLQIALEGTNGLRVEVPADEMLLQRVYGVAPAGSAAAAAGRAALRIWLEDAESGTGAKTDTSFTGKGG